MADKQSDSGFSDNAPGGRQNQSVEHEDQGDHHGQVANNTQGQPQSDSQVQQGNPVAGNERPPIRGLTKQEVEQVSGSLKVHIKLNLDVDLRVQASLNGDIVIGVL